MVYCIVLGQWNWVKFVDYWYRQLEEEGEERKISHPRTTRMDRANSVHILVSDDTVLRAATTRLIEKPIHVPTNKEDYTDFALSNGWLFSLKTRNRLSSKKTKGDGGKVDEALLPGMQDELKKELEDHALWDVCNCNELVL